MDSEARQRSRNGCLTCRQKRKKCDEAKPACTRCARGDEHCVWPPPRVPKRLAPLARGSSYLPRIQSHPTTTQSHPTTTQTHLQKSGSPPSPTTSHPTNPITDDMLAQHTYAFARYSHLDNSLINNNIPGDSPLVFAPTPWVDLDIGQSYGASGLLLRSSSWQLPPPCILGQPVGGIVGPRIQRLVPGTPEYASEDRIVRIDDELDEDEEAVFKTTEWLPATKYMIRTIILGRDETSLSSALDSYLTFIVRYSYDPTIIPDFLSSICARLGASESGRLAVMSTANLFQSFLSSSASPDLLRRRAEELIRAAEAALRVETSLPGTNLIDKLAGISEIMNYYYYSGDIAGYQKCIDQATPIVKALVGSDPLKFHKLNARGLQAIDIQIFVWCDVFSSLVLCRPTRLVYDCNVEELLRENQEGPNLEQTGTLSGLEWMGGLPNALMMLTMQIINLRHSQHLPAERTAQAGRIESALRGWKVWPSSTTNSMMKVQRTSAQEIWRHFVILYLYHAIHKASPSNEMVQQSVRQIIQLASTLRPGHNPDCLLYAPYFMAGTFAASAQHRHFFKTRILECNIQPYSRKLTKALEEIWRDSEDSAAHHDWLTRSPPIAIMF